MLRCSIFMSYEKTIDTVASFSFCSIHFELKYPTLSNVWYSTRQPYTLSCSTFWKPWLDLILIIMKFLKLHRYRGSMSLEGRIPNSLFLLHISCNFNAKNEEKPMFMVLRLNIDKMQFIYKTAIESTIKLCIFWH